MRAVGSRLAGTAPRSGLLANPRFRDWPAGTLAPTGWQIFNATAERDTTRTFGPEMSASLKLTGAGGGFLYQDLTAVSHLAGQSVSVLAWARRESDLATSVARVGLTIYAPSGNIVHTIRSYDVTGAAGSLVWCGEFVPWAICDVRRPSDLTKIRVVLNHASSAHAANPAWFAGASLVAGRLPRKS